MNITSHDQKYHVTLNDVIQIVFIILKLCKLIDWSWWAVLIPFWVSLGLLTIQSIVIAAKYKAKAAQKSNVRGG